MKLMPEWVCFQCELYIIHSPQLFQIEVMQVSLEDELCHQCLALTMVTDVRLVIRADGVFLMRGVLS